MFLKSYNAVLLCTRYDGENIKKKLEVITKGRIVVRKVFFDNILSLEDLVKEIKDENIAYGIIAANVTGLQDNNNIWKYIDLFMKAKIKKIRLIPSELVKKDYLLFSLDEISDFLTPVKKWRELPVAKILLSESCNLNCSGCTHFIPLSPSKHNITLNEYRRYLLRLKKVFGYIKEINLLGGEPLLNKELAQIITTTKELLPYTDISIISNGILVTSMPKELTDIMKANNVFFLLTLYKPLVNKIDEVCKFLDERGIPFLLSGEVSEFRIQYNLSGKNDAFSIHSRCLDRFCHTICGDKIYSCYYPATVKWANEYFGIDIPFENEGINLFLHERRDAPKIVKQLCQPMNICKFCNGFNDIETKPWKQFEKNDDISNWFTN